MPILPSIFKGVTAHTSILPSVVKGLPAQISILPSVFKGLTAQIHILPSVFKCLTVQMSISASVFADLLSVYTESLKTLGKTKFFYKKLVFSNKNQQNQENQVFGSLWRSPGP